MRFSISDFGLNDRLTLAVGADTNYRIDGKPTAKMYPTRSGCKEQHITLVLIDVDLPEDIIHQRVGVSLNPLGCTFIAAHNLPTLSHLTCQCGPTATESRSIRLAGKVGRLLSSPPSNIDTSRWMVSLIISVTGIFMLDSEGMV